MDETRNFRISAQLECALKVAHYRLIILTQDKTHLQGIHFIITAIAFTFSPLSYSQCTLFLQRIARAKQHRAQVGREQRTHTFQKKRGNFELPALIQFFCAPIFDKILKQNLRALYSRGSLKNSKYTVYLAGIYPDRIIRLLQLLWGCSVVGLFQIFVFFCLRGKNISEPRAIFHLIFLQQRYAYTRDNLSFHSKFSLPIECASVARSLSCSNTSGDIKI